MEKLAEITLYNQRMDMSYQSATVNITSLNINGDTFEAGIEGMDRDDFYAVLHMLIDSHIDYQIYGEKKIYINGAIVQIVSMHWYK